MGGRGAAGGGGGRAGNGKSGADGGGGNSPFKIPKGLSKSVLKSLTRNQLETLATSIFANEAMKRGVSKADGVYQARSLMGGNTTTQLINYISKRI